ncbi:MAG TPA: hemerythrin domain-containing protein [Methylomirabilota bacterium]|nr:hemerythrin domain-containing protein [Methylomirabilota bacterium]
MQATEILRQEHDVILKMLDGLDQMNQTLLANAEVARGTFDGFLEFFRLFADRCHHGKEEDLLFPMLEQRGIPRGGGPIGVMLHEHDHGRELIQEMAAAAAEYEKDRTTGSRRWVRAAQSYSQLLRDHILKENNILFHMAEQLLTSEEQISLAAAFEKTEMEKIGVGTHERLQGQVEELLTQVEKSHAAVSNKSR